MGMGGSFVAIFSLKRNIQVNFRMGQFIISCSEVFFIMSHPLPQHVSIDTKAPSETRPRLEDEETVKAPPQAGKQSSSSSAFDVNTFPALGRLIRPTQRGSLIAWAERGCPATEIFS